MRPLTPGRRLVLTAATAWTLGLAVLALVLRQAAPGPAGQDVLGVGIGRYNGPGGIAYLSGRRLACGPPTRAHYTARCTVEIAGGELELLARRNPPGHPNQLGGACEAVYAGRAWPCRIGGRHVHVHWFAYLDEPLGLTPAELDAVRRAHPLPNLPQDVFFVALFLVPTLTALGAGAGLTFWLAEGDPGRLGSAGGGWAAVWGALATPVAFVPTFVATALATSGYWD